MHDAMRGLSNAHKLRILTAHKCISVARCPLLPGYYHLLDVYTSEIPGSPFMLNAYGVCSPCWTSWRSALPQHGPSQPSLWACWH